MKALISKSKIEGTVAAPSSKSYTIRGLLCGALANGKSQIGHPLGSDDTEAATRVLRKVGARIRQNRQSWTVEGGSFHQPDGDLFCGDSAATLRFMTAICSVIPGISHLTAGASLSKRPVKPLIDALRHLDVKCSASGGLPPVTVEGGRLVGGNTSLPGDISSQFVSAMLMVAPFAEQSVTVRLTTPLESKPYVLMTMDTMQWFGVTVGASMDLDEFQVFPQKYQPTKYEIEGDWSSASYLLALGVLAGDVEVTNLPSETMQGDRMLVDFPACHGCRCHQRAATRSLPGNRDCMPFPSTWQTASTCCPRWRCSPPWLKGTSRFSGIARARLKESDRVAAMREGLARMGISTAEETNCFDHHRRQTRRR